MQRMHLHTCSAPCAVTLHTLLPWFIFDPTLNFLVYACSTDEGVRFVYPSICMWSHGMFQSTSFAVVYINIVVSLKSEACQKQLSAHTCIHSELLHIDKHMSLKLYKCRLPPLMVCSKQDTQVRLLLDTAKCMIRPYNLRHASCSYSSTLCCMSSLTQAKQCKQTHDQL